MSNSLIVATLLSFAGAGETDSTRIVVPDSVAIDSAVGDRRVLSGSRPSAPRSWRSGVAATPKDPRIDTTRPGSETVGTPRPYLGGRRGHFADRGVSNPGWYGFAVSAWGERFGLQIGFPLGDSSNHLVFGVGGAYSIDNSRSENIRSRTAFREVSASCDFRRAPVWGVNGSGWEAFYDLGWHMRFLSHHAVVDSEQVERVYDNGRYQDRVVSNPHVVDYNGVGMQPYFGIGASRAVFREGTRLQVRLGTGPEWLFAGSHSRFALRSHGSIGLEFRL